MANEVEIKFRIHDLRKLEQSLIAAGFRRITPSTREMNTLYDLPGRKLRQRGELLRLRQYGETWVLTYKAPPVVAKNTRKTGSEKVGSHKVRIERETRVENGKEMDVILRALGFSPSFRYEKFRAEWSDGNGHVVVDQTPIGDYGEIEGPARWIDSTARALGIVRQDYITVNYASLFFEWKRQTQSPAEEMTFRAVGKKNLNRRDRWARREP